MKAFRGTDGEEDGCWSIAHPVLEEGEGRGVSSCGGKGSGGSLVPHPMHLHFLLQIQKLSATSSPSPIYNVPLAPP